jgi:ribose transport system substrate-binding protein
MLVVCGLVFAACGSSSSSTATSGGGTEASEGGDAASAPYVKKAEQVVAAGSAHDVTLGIPKSGEPVEEGKKLACVLTEAANETVAKWCKSLKEIGEKFGWSVSEYDGQGTPNGEQKAILSAAATKPDVIILGAVKLEALTGAVEQAATQGSVIVSMNSSTEFGKVAEAPGVFWNVQPSSKEYGELTASIIIASSEGTGKAIMISDETYPIARAQTKAFETTFDECTTCEYLGYQNVPTTSAAKEMPARMTSWIQKYPEPFYVASQNDAVWIDTIGSGLNGVPPEGRVMLIGKEGSPGSFEKIRNDEFITGTVVSPTSLAAYMAFDEANRGLHGEEPIAENPPYHLVTSENIEEELPDGTESWDPVWTGYQQQYEELWETGSRK